MTERDQVRHLLRRFGFGATPEEVNAYTKAGLQATIKSVIEFDQHDEGFNVSPWELAREEGKDEIYLDPYRPAQWWSLRMVMTKRPLQEKLTLFWHNHFAISGVKVELGPAMLSYNEVLRKHAAGNFRDMLKAVSREPAMLFWLDTHTSIKGHPNENFAREVMELFTLGIGHYTEKDVQEAARAFTGWGLRFIAFENGGDKLQQTAKECIAHNRPFVAFTDSPDLHDDEVKTILGTSKKWTQDDVLEMLAERPETAQRICRKLWEFFAYPDPEPAVVDRLAKVLQEGNLDIKPVLYAMVNAPEFWSEKCLRHVVKCPVDFVVPLVRQLGIPEFLVPQHPKMEPEKALGGLMRGISGIVMVLCSQQGMQLLFPPTVAGWNWGSAWISSDSMSQRVKLGALLMGEGGADKGGAGAMIARIKAQGVISTSEEMADALLHVVDADLPSEKRALVVQACAKHGGPEALTSPEKASPCLAAMLKLVFAAPEFHFC